MTKEKYRELLVLVNDKGFMDLLIKYADMRIEMHQKFLETEKEPMRLYERQGAIAELRRVETLRDEVIKGVENGTNNR